MDFSFSSDQQDLRELAAKILSDATTLERTKRVVAESDGFDRDLWAALAQAGIIGISLPESVGGAGLGFLETCIVLEEVGRTAAPIPALAVMALAAPALAEFGATDALAGVAAGTTIVTAALTEAVGDAYEPSTAATGGKLTGEKVCVPAGLDAKAIVVSAIDGVYLVDPSASGVTLEREDTMLGAPTGAPRAARRGGHQAGRPRRPHLAARAGADRDVGDDVGSLTGCPRPHCDLREGARAVRARHRHVPGGEPADRRHLHQQGSDEAHRRGRRRGGSMPAFPPRHRSTRRSTGPRRAGRTCSSPRTTSTVVSVSTATTRCTATSCWRSRWSSTWARRHPR